MRREPQEQPLARGPVRLRRVPGDGTGDTADETAAAPDAAIGSRGTLKAGAGTLKADADTLEADADTPESGTDSLENGTATLESGPATLESGAATPESGAATLENDAATPENDAGTLEGAGSTDAGTAHGATAHRLGGAVEEPRAAARILNRIIGPGPPGGLRLRWALLIGLAGGAALTAAFPPYGIWPLAVVGPALLVVALRQQGLRGSFAVGAVFGLAFFVPLLSWVVNVAWYAWAALAISEALIFAVFAVGQRLLLRLRAWPVAVAGWWVAAEAFRDRWPWGGFPWGRLAMSQASAPTVRWVSAGGPPLLTFLIALAGACLAWLIVERRVLPAAGFACAAGVALAGAALPVTTSGPASASVAAVQGDVPHARNLPTLFNDTQITQNHATATERLAAQVKAGRRAAPDLVIWPENSTDLDPFEYPAIYQEIMTAVRAIGRPILVGEFLQHPARNVGQLWVPGEGPTTIYAKRQLVPFGEVIPFRGLLSHITSLVSLQPVNLTPGHRAVVFPVGRIRLGDVICYEIGFDDLVRSEVAAGANLLSAQSNDATFEVDGQTGESLQQLAMARIRAVEFDRSVVVASTTGVSAIIAPDGSLIAHSGTWQQAVLDARVPLLTSRTLAERVGGWPEYVITALTAIALVAAAAGAVAERRRLSTRPM
jgi:apolipoprotein N-acyltransferase